MDERVQCLGCGARAEHLPLGWSLSVENGVRVHRCETCSREQVRSMEAKLDPEWW